MSSVGNKGVSKGRLLIPVYIAAIVAIIILASIGGFTWMGYLDLDWFSLTSWTNRFRIIWKYFPAFMFIVTFAGVCIMAWQTYGSEKRGSGTYAAIIAIGGLAFLIVNFYFIWDLMASGIMWPYIGLFALWTYLGLQFRSYGVGFAIGMIITYTFTALMLAFPEWQPLLDSW